MTVVKLKTQFELSINNESGYNLEFKLNMVDGKPYLIVRKPVVKNTGKTWKEVEQLVKFGGEVRRESWYSGMLVFYRDGGFSIRASLPDGRITVNDYTPASDKADWIIVKYPDNRINYYEAMDAVRNNRLVTNDDWNEGAFIKLVDGEVRFIHRTLDVVYHPLQKAMQSHTWRVLN